jgi:hypothetical protein
MKPLRRQSTRGAQIAVTLGIGVVLAALPLFVFTRPAPLIARIVAGAFGIVSLLLFYSALHQLFALRTPETLVECDADELRRGKEVRLRFRQSGSASFESLRANLVGDEHWTELVPGHRRVRRYQHIATVNIYDSGAFTAPFDETVTVRIPPDLPRASVKGRGERWRLEVWGNVHGRADVQHVFPLRLH